MCFDILKVDGKLPTIKDRNDGLMLRANVCLQKLIEIAAQRRRNYIIDHVRSSCRYALSNKLSLGKCESRYSVKTAAIIHWIQSNRCSHRAR